MKKEIIISSPYIIFENETVKNAVDEKIKNNGKFIMTCDWYLFDECIEDVEITIEIDNNEYVVSTVKDGEYLNLIDDYSPLDIHECDI